MFPKVFGSFCVMALCVVIHASGVSAALRRLRSPAVVLPRFWRFTWLFILVATWMVSLALIEITVWAGFYVWRGALATFQDAWYFSAVTYTTTGYGDLVLPPEWRYAGGVEAITGILMCGWSTGFFFALVSRVHQRAEAEAAAVDAGRTALATGRQTSDADRCLVCGSTPETPRQGGASASSPPGVRS